MLCSSLLPYNSSSKWSSASFSTHMYVHRHTCTHNSLKISHTLHRRATHKLGKAGSTLHHKCGRADSTPHVRRGGGPSNLNRITQLPPRHTFRALNWLSSTSTPVYDLLDCVEGTDPAEHSCSISMTQDNSRISERRFGEGPTLTVYRKPEDLNVTKKYYAMNICK